jgi:voltage-gated potassium channel
METAATKGNQLGILNLVVFVLSVYVLMAIFIDTVFVLPSRRYQSQNGIKTRKSH